VLAGDGRCDAKVLGAEDSGDENGETERETLMEDALLELIGDGAKASKACSGKTDE
jgi:hypothetical protein